jgi:hypothetical protein
MLAGDALGEDVWGVVAQYCSMATRSALLGVSKATRDAVVRTMASAAGGDTPITLLRDQTWARVSAVLLGKSTFVTGGGGVGKTFTSTTIIDDLQHFYETPHGRIEYAAAKLAHETAVAEAARVEAARDLARTRGNPVPPTPLPFVPPAPPQPHTKKILVTASTGVAAHLVDGSTVHSSFNMRKEARGADGKRIYELTGTQATQDTEGVVDHDDAASELKANEWWVVHLDSALKSRLLATDVLLIDEVSMLDADIFNLVDNTCRKARAGSSPDAEEKPFGGLVVLPVGDFCQLGPVIPDHERDDANEDEEHDFCFLSTSWNLLQPCVVELIEFVRFDRSKPTAVRWMEVQSRLRKAEKSRLSEDIEWITRNMHQARFGQGERPMLLTTRTKIRERRNNIMLARLTTPLHRRCAVTHPDACHRYEVRIGGVDEHGKELSLHDKRAWKWIEQPSVPVKHNPRAARTFKVRLGMRVRCTKNVNARGPDGLFHTEVPNGAMGTVIDIGFDEFRPDVVESVTVRYDQASAARGRFVHTHKPSWYDKVQARKHVADNGEKLLLKAYRLQFALEPCYAKTVHSAQGSSIFEVADLAIGYNRAKMKIVDGKKEFLPVHGLVCTAMGRYASVDLIRHWPQQAKGSGEAKTYEDVPERMRDRCPIFRPEDVYCDERVLDFYDVHAGRTPAWVR